MRDFLTMGGYGGYVWPAYIISAVVLIALAVAIWLRGRSLSRKLKELDADSARDQQR